MHKQIFGYTCPSTPDFGNVGYLCAMVHDYGVQISVRAHRDVTGALSHLVLPHEEAIKLANAILEQEKANATD